MIDTRQKMRTIGVHALLPLFAGGFLYMGIRSSHLLMFRWFSWIRLDSLIEWLRTVMSPAYDLLPEWMIYSLPDALWIYSFTVFLGVLWIDAPGRDRYLFLALGPLIGIGGELGQGWGLLPGTFDVVDLVLMTAASGLALYVVSRLTRRGSKPRAD